MWHCFPVLCGGWYSWTTRKLQIQDQLPFFKGSFSLFNREQKVHLTEMTFCHLQVPLGINGINLHIRTLLSSHNQLYILKCSILPTLPIDTDSFPTTCASICFGCFSSNYCILVVFFLIWWIFSTRFFSSSETTGGFFFIHGAGLMLILWPALRQIQAMPGPSKKWN